MFDEPPSYVASKLEVGSIMDRLIDRKPELLQIRADSTDDLTADHAAVTVSSQHTASAPVLEVPADIHTHGILPYAYACH